MAVSKVPKDLRALAKRYVAKGWTLKPTRSGHIKWTAPGGQVVISGSTPSDWRSVKNTAAHLARTSRMAVAA